MQKHLLSITRKYRRSALIVTHGMDEGIMLADRLILMAKDHGETRLREWNLRAVFGSAGADMCRNAQRNRRSSVFMDLREDIAADLAAGSAVRPETQAKVCFAVKRRRERFKINLLPGKTGGLSA